MFVEEFAEHAHMLDASCLDDEFDPIRTECRIRVGALKQWHQQAEDVLFELRGHQSIVADGGLVVGAFALDLFAPGGEFFDVARAVVQYGDLEIDEE